MRPLNPGIPRTAWEHVHVLYPRMKQKNGKSWICSSYILTILHTHYFWAAGSSFYVTVVKCGLAPRLPCWHLHLSPLTENREFPESMVINAWLHRSDVSDTHHHSSMKYRNLEMIIVNMPGHRVEWLYYPTQLWLGRMWVCRFIKTKNTDFFSQRFPNTVLGTPVYTACSAECGHLVTTFRGQRVEIKANGKGPNLHSGLIEHKNDGSTYCKCAIFRYFNEAQNWLEQKPASTGVSRTEFEKAFFRPFLHAVVTCKASAIIL